MDQVDNRSGEDGPRIGRNKARRRRVGCTIWGNRRRVGCHDRAERTVKPLNNNAGHGVLQAVSKRARNRHGFEILPLLGGRILSLVLGSILKRSVLGDRIAVKGGIAVYQRVHPRRRIGKTKRIVRCQERIRFNDRCVRIARISIVRAVRIAARRQKDQCTSEVHCKPEGPKIHVFTQVNL